ncbi:rhodanese-like domain-containing protein [Paracoccus shanxieyensis]|uniref:rhodanese-like domain-containing protein n=1 Tax=Paracoccus shanxieyensis TaxID=2675752 RepID=UPI0018ACCCC9|nr:rhodanese-like domain-containing protein [Paracoccus shanxieyensis]
MSNGLIRALCLTALLAAPGIAAAQALFDAAGYRIASYRAPVPDQAPGAQTVTARQVQQLRAQGALLLDVLGLQQYTIADDGTWLTPERRQSLPGAVWLPVVGWGKLEPWQQHYLNDSLAALTHGDKAMPIVVFCKVDCWVSWNTAKRLHEMGHSRLYWFSGGAEAWQDAGFPLQPVTPRPLRRDKGSPPPP